MRMSQGPAREKSEPGSFLLSQLLAAQGPPEAFGLLGAVLGRGAGRGRGAGARQGGEKHAGGGGRRRRGGSPPGVLGKQIQTFSTADDKETCQMVSDP